MRRALAIAAGIVVGILLAGVISAALIGILPPRLRVVQVVWTATALVVALTVWGFWTIAGPRRD